MLLAYGGSYLYLSYERREAAAAWFHKDDSAGWEVGGLLNEMVTVLFCLSLWWWHT